jgi:hypothetical protein
VGSPGVICHVSSLSAIDVYEFTVLHEGYSADNAKVLCLCCDDVNGFSLVMTINKKGTKKKWQRSNLLLFIKK